MPEKEQVVEVTGDVYKFLDPELKDYIYFLLKNNNGEVMMKLSDLLLCLKFAEEKGEIPTLPKEWWNQICNSYPESALVILHIQLKPTKKNNVMEYNFTNKNKADDIFALAKAFLSISKMTNKKLQKLCYYAKAWYLALYDCNLISEQFQAWVEGAVQPALYQKYKRYGYGDIPQFTNIQELPEEFLSFAREIYESYGHLTGFELEEINHQETPWLEARGTCKPWESCSNEISEESMKLFYRKMII